MRDVAAEHFVAAESELSDAWADSHRALVHAVLSLAASVQELAASRRPASTAPPADTQRLQNDEQGGKV